MPTTRTDESTPGRSVGSDEAPAGGALDELAAYVAALRSIPAPKTCRVLRQEAGLSLQDIAGAFEPPVSRHTVLAWEEGRRSPNREHASQYAAILRRLRAL